MTRGEELLAAGIAALIGLAIAMAAREWGRYLRELDQWRADVEETQHMTPPPDRTPPAGTWQQLHHRRTGQP